MNQTDSSAKIGVRAFLLSAAIILLLMIFQAFLPKFCLREHLNVLFQKAESLS